MSSYPQYMVKTNVIQMMSDRGYDISRVRYLETDEVLDDRQILQMEMGEFLDSFPEVSDLSAIYIQKETGRKTMVYFASKTGDIRIDVIRVVLKQAGDLYAQEKGRPGINRVGLILITNHPLLPKSKKVFDSPELPNIVRERFIYDQLMINIPQNPDVPRAFLVMEADIPTVLRRLQCYNAQGLHPEWLPKMMDTDPQARWYGFQPGQIIGFYRNDPPIGTMINGSIAYRFVISSAVVEKKKTVKVIGEEMQVLDDEEMAMMDDSNPEFIFEE